MKLYLIRHGETQENVDGIVQGWLDTKLNDTGVEQAKHAALIFNESIVAIYSSDLQRCVQTAVFFKDKYPDVAYIEDTRLRERNFGDAQGMHRDLLGDEVFWSSQDNSSLPFAETLDEYDNRIADFLNDIKKKHAINDEILIVTHGGAINRIIKYTAKNKEYHPLANCELAIVDLL